VHVLDVTLVIVNFNVRFDDAADAHFDTEFAFEIHSQMFESQGKLMPRPKYMDGQPEINFLLRGILMDELVAVHRLCGLSDVTLFSTRSLVDRYLSVRTVSSNELKLVGVSCMVIASNLENMHLRLASRLEHLSGGACMKNDIFNMECTILSALTFKIASTTEVDFLDRLVGAPTAVMVSSGP